MTMQLWAGLTLMAGAIALSTWGGAVLIGGRREAAIGYLQGGSPVLRIRTDTAGNARSRVGILARLGARMTPSARRNRMLAVALKAGDKNLVDVALSARVLGLVAAGALLWLASPVLGLLAGVIGWFGPELWLKRRAEARATAIRRALPDFLDLLAISVEAGAGLDAAMARAASEVGGPAGYEFHQLLHALSLGSSRREAFVALKERAQVRELSSFVLALLQAEALGISLTAVLRTQAKEMRGVRRRLAREQAARAPVKILFPLVFGIFPALMLVVLGPAAIRIMQTLGG